MMVNIDDYDKELQCRYKNELYYVRDNGAVMRHSREGMRVRKYDNKWIFGNKNPNTGYMEISGERVHRIVAYAFHGEPPTDEYVVDHIDTNRCNNRPENLRWLTRLENVLNNEITCSKIIAICGSIEAFVDNPSILRGYESVNTNFKWMKTVTPEEARISYEKWKKWSEEKPKPQGKQIDEWIFTDNKPKLPRNINVDKAVSESYKFDYDNTFVDVSNEEQSLTSNVIQINWRVVSEFPLCPQEIKENPINEYSLNLIKGAVFCRNKIYQSQVLDSIIIDKGETLIVMTQSVYETPKPWAIAKITFVNNVYIHENIAAFFKEEGALKRYTILQGKEWTGGDSIDDYC